MSKDMRGLTQYIADLRACRVRELEEKRVNKEMAHIRQKFKEGNLDGYQRKKYLSKIVFTYILGYQVDVGHMEAVNLIASSKYSEKQIGYLALTLLMHENDDLVRLIVNSIRKDLDSMDEVHNCLALHAIANIGGREMADSLAADVHRLLISPTSKSFVKKKAALTLLRLFRKYPECIEVKEWALRIVSIMDDHNLGVALSVTSLVSTLAQDNLEDMAICYQKAVNRLNKIVLQQEYGSDYVYYRVPVPWLQVKLLRLLQYYPPAEDPSIRLILHNVLKAILDGSQTTPKNVQHNNAQNAVLFEAIALAIHLDPESPVVATAAQLLGRFILSRETNVRYLGMDTMAQLAAKSESLQVVKKHQDTVIYSLKDRDVSVRRRALDLLYSMCDGTNAKIIVAELLKYLSVADYTLREEMVLKIAILTEKFATEYEWYVDTILSLMSTAGDYVGEEVWYRIVQIVTNTEELQEYAARKVYEHLRSPTCHENIVKVAAYILGEFGHLIADEEDSSSVSPIEQFTLINSKIGTCSSSTKGLILTTYVKWLNLFPEIKAHILVILQKFTHTLDAELQQRACEYLTLASMPEETILQVVLDEMPPFPESRESALLNRLMSKHLDNGDKRARSGSIGLGKGSERADGLGPPNRRKGLPVKENGNHLASQEAAAASAAAVQIDADATTQDLSGGMADTSAPYVAPDDIMSGLAGLDLSSNPPSLAATPAAGFSEATQPLYPAGTPVVETVTTQPLAAEQSPSSEQRSATSLDAEDASADDHATGDLIEPTYGSEKFLPRLSYNSEGVLFEDAQLQVGIKTEYHGHLGRLALYFGNKISASFTSFTVTVQSQESGNLNVTLPRLPPSTLSATTQIQQVVQVDCKDSFALQPVLRISYLAGSHQTITVLLPVWINRFLEPVQLSQVDFFERWKQIGGAPREAQSIFPVRLTSSGAVDLGRNKKVVKGMKFGLLDGIDPNPNNIVAASVLHMQNGKVGCLLRLEPNTEAKLCRLTIRTTNEKVSKELVKLVQSALEGSKAK